MNVGITWSASMPPPESSHGIVVFCRGVEVMGEIIRCISKGDAYTKSSPIRGGTSNLSADVEALLQLVLAVHESDMCTDMLIRSTYAMHLLAFRLEEKGV